MEASTVATMNEALTYLAKADPAMAVKVLSPLFEVEFECPELVFVSRCCNFWAARLDKASSIDSSLERGEALITDWKRFMKDISASMVCYEDALYAARRAVFSRALECYEIALQDDVSTIGLRRAALCCKRLGDYDKALKYLSYAMDAKSTPAVSVGKSEEAATLAELADCYALCGGDRNAKVLFKEAFFVDAEGVDISALDSELIRVLITKTAALGYKGVQLQRWIPVWGVLWGVLCIKRRITTTEAAAIRSEIFALENEMSSVLCDKEAVTPRLLNLYFWYIDYLSAMPGRDKQVNDVLLKIKILDKAAYEQYIK